MTQMWKDARAQVIAYTTAIDAHSNTLVELTDEQERDQQELNQAIISLKGAQNIRIRIARLIAVGVQIARVFDLAERYMRHNGIPIPQEPTR